MDKIFEDIQDIKNNSIPYDNIKKYLTLHDQDLYIDYEEEIVYELYLTEDEEYYFFDDNEYKKINNNINKVQHLYYKCNNKYFDINHIINCVLKNLDNHKKFKYKCNPLFVFDWSNHICIIKADIYYSNKTNNKEIIDSIEEANKEIVLLKELKNKIANGILRKCHMMKSCHILTCQLNKRCNCNDKCSSWTYEYRNKTYNKSFLLPVNDNVNILDYYDDCMKKEIDNFIHIIRENPFMYKYLFNGEEIIYKKAPNIYRLYNYFSKVSNNRRLNEFICYDYIEFQVEDNGIYHFYPTDDSGQNTIRGEPMTVLPFDLHNERNGIRLGFKDNYILIALSKLYYTYDNNYNSLPKEYCVEFKNIYHNVYNKIIKDGMGKKICDNSECLPERVQYVLNIYLYKLNENGKIVRIKKRPMELK